MSKIGSGFMLFKALARTPSSTIVIRWWFITRCKCRFCKRLCVNVPLAGSTTKRPTKVNTRAALAATGSSDGHEAQKPIAALIWRKNSIHFLSAIFTVWPEPNLIKVSGWWQMPPQHQSAYIGKPESASIEIPPFQTSLHKIFKNWFLLSKSCSQCSHLEVLLLSKFGSEMGDFNRCRFWASCVCTLMLL